MQSFSNVTCSTCGTRMALLTDPRAADVFGPDEGFHPVCVACGSRDVIFGEAFQDEVVWELNLVSVDASVHDGVLVDPAHARRPGPGPTVHIQADDFGKALSRAEEIWGTTWTWDSGVGAGIAYGCKPIPLRDFEGDLD